MLRSVFIKECSSSLDVSEENLAQVVTKIRAKKYHEERASKETQQSDKEEETQFIDAVTPFPETAALPYPTPSKSTDIQTIERIILQTLVNRGEETAYISQKTYENQNEIVEIRLDQFIFDNLCNDDIVFENELYQKFFEIYADIAEKQSKNIVSAMRLHDDEHIRNLCIELIEMPLQESPHWESERIKSYIRSIYNDKSKSLEDVVRTLQKLKLLKIKILRDEKLEELKELSHEDDQNLCLYEIRELNKKISEIESVLGTTYRV